MGNNKLSDSLVDLLLAFVFNFEVRVKSGSIRNIVIGAIFVIALAIVLFRGESFFELVETMRTGALIPLIIAFVVQMGKYLSQSFAYSASFRTVEERLSPLTCFPLVFSSFFMNTIAPSLNTSGNLVFVDTARRRGVGGGRATAAVILMQTSIETGFMVIMLVGFIIIQLNGSLTSVIFIVGMWVVILVGLMGGSLILARKNPKALVGILRPLESFANGLSKRFRKKPMNPWANKAAEALCEAAGEIGKNPATALSVFLLSVLASTFELGCFCFVGIAFGITDPAALLSGYVVAILFTMIAITPMGLGVVEALVVLQLTAYGVGTAPAMAATLVFRGIVFWLPFLIGLVSFQITQRRFAPKDRGSSADDLPSSDSPTDPPAASPRPPIDSRVSPPADPPTNSRTSPPTDPSTNSSTSPPQA